MTIDPRLINVAIEELPSVIAWIRTAFHDSGAVEPTDAEVLAALNSVIVWSLTVDDRWLAAHPPPVT